MADVWCLQTHEVNAYCWYSGVFTSEEIDKIADLSEVLFLEKAKVGGSDSKERSEVVAEDVRKTTIGWIPIKGDCEWIYRRLTDITNEANKKWFDFDLRHIEGLQFTLYEKDMYYTKHVDTMYQSIGLYPRKLSFSLQLTDPSEYEGGDLLIHNGHEPIIAEKEKGSITFFPSYTLHEVTPITRGVRKSLVGWVRGPLFK